MSCISGGVTTNLPGVLYSTPAQVGVESRLYEGAIFGYSE